MQLETAKALLNIEHLQEALERVNKKVANSNEVRVTQAQTLQNDCTSV